MMVADRVSGGRVVGRTLKSLGNGGAAVAQSCIPAGTSVTSVTTGKVVPEIFENASNKMKVATER